MATVIANVKKLWCNRCDLGIDVSIQDGEFIVIVGPQDAEIYFIANGRGT